MEFTITINGEMKAIKANPREILLDVLRREGYFGVKRGCSEGSCGACMILLDGIPALHFMPDQYPVERLVEGVNRVVELFYPRLILGISDEIPPDGDIERVRLVGELVQKLV